MKESGSLYIFRRVFQGVMAVLLAMFIIVGYNYLKDPQRVPVRMVKVSGKLTYLPQEDIQAVIAPYVETSFVTVNISGLRRALQENPWVYEVQVRRHWPDTLVVELTEQQPIAYWGDRAMVNNEGEAFAPQVLPILDLPRWSGPSEELTQVYEMYAVLNKAVAPVDVRIDSLSLSARWAWHAVLSSGLSIALGSEDVSERLTRFVQLSPVDIKAPQGVQYVDLRYTNGFVVKQAGRDWR